MVKKVRIIFLALLSLVIVICCNNENYEQIKQISKLKVSEANMIVSDSVSSDFKFIGTQQSDAYLCKDSIILNIYQSTFTNKILVSFSIFGNTSYTSYLRYNNDIVDAVFTAKNSKLNLIQKQYQLNDTLEGFFENDYSFCSIKGNFKCVIDTIADFLPIYSDELAERNGILDNLNKTGYKRWKVLNIDNE